MHGLKCAVCGKEYFYDSKICRECRDYAIYSGLTKGDFFVGNSVNINYKWNCTQFLTRDSNTITESTSNKRNFCITKEPKNYKIESNVNYKWNPGSITKLKTCLEESIKQANLDLSPEILDDLLDFIKVRSGSILSYE